jgi:hypothetical protein
LGTQGPEKADIAEESSYFGINKKNSSNGIAIIS